MDLQQEVDLLGPWHYSFEIKGARTGDSPPDPLHDKLRRLINAGLFSRPAYEKVLDLGANAGLISEWFVRNKHSKVTAVEYGPKYYKQLEFVIKHKELSEYITPLNEDITNREWEFMKYDLVLFLGTLHHLKPQIHAKVLERCLYTLVPGGEIVVQTKSEFNVAALLSQTGFIAVQEVPNTNWGDRKAWTAIKDPMKIL